MTIAFWIKVLPGVPNHGDQAGIFSTKEESDMEGWEIVLINWNDNKIMKFEVNDYQSPGKRFQKEMDEITFQTWIHYVAIYHLINPSDPDDQFEIYKNGQLDNNGYANAPSTTISQNVVDELAIGRRTITDTGPPYSNALLDELMFFDGELDADMITKLYEHYQII